MTDLDLADLRRGVEQGWPIKNERVAQLLGLLDSATARIESLEARLARLTDDSMAERIAEPMSEEWPVGWYGSESDMGFIVAYEGDGEWVSPNGATVGPDYLVDDLVHLVPQRFAAAAIRAVAADGEVPDAERYPIGHRLCTQDCKQQENGEHCFACREPWPCAAADEQEATDVG